MSSSFQSMVGLSGGERCIRIDVHAHPHAPVLASIAMTDSLVPAQTALLVMDFQPGIVGMLSEPEPLLDRAAEAIALARGRGGAVGYVRVAFTRPEIEALPPGGA